MTVRVVEQIAENLWKIYYAGANLKKMLVAVNITRDFLLCHSRVLDHAFYYI